MITKIEVTKDGAPSTITQDEWKTMPLPERVGLLGKAAVRFYDGATEISARDALKILKG